MFATLLMCEIVRAGPDVVLTTPADGASFIAPATLTLTAAASSTKGPITSVEFFDNGVSLGISTSAPFGLPVSLPAGIHQLTAKATDSNGAATTSSISTITSGYTLSLTVAYSNLDDVTDGLGGLISVEPELTVYTPGSIVVLTVISNYVSSYPPTFDNLPRTNIFAGWSGDATGVATPLAVTMDGNKTIKADFISRGRLFLVNTSSMDGASESPPNPSPGGGLAQVYYNPDSLVLHVDLTFNGLMAPTTACHIHAPTATSGSGTAGVALNIPIPTGVTLGEYHGDLDLTAATNYSSGFLAANGGTTDGARAALLPYLTGEFGYSYSYMNIDTTVFPTGEVMGFLYEYEFPMDTTTYLASPPNGASFPAPAPVILYARIIGDIGDYAQHTNSPPTDVEFFDNGVSLGIIHNQSAWALRPALPLTLTAGAHSIHVVQHDSNGAVFQSQDNAINVGYTLALDSNGPGSVTKSPDQPIYLPGTTVTLTATPTGCSSFTDWALDGKGSPNPMTIVMTANKAVKAAFRAGPPVVANLNDNGPGSLRQAILDAPRCSPPSITFAPGMSGTIMLTSGELQITNDLVVVGPGANVLAVDGNGTSRVFAITNGNVSISGLTITNGTGGIYNSNAVLSLSNCVVVGHHGTAINSGHGVFNDANGVLTMVGCTIAGNSVTAGTPVAGGIFNAASTSVLKMTNSTVSGNSCSSASAGQHSGGGIYNAGTAMIVACTICSNSVSGGLPRGGGIRNNGGTLVLGNSIVAGNTSSGGFGSDVDPGATSLGYNLIGTTNNAAGWIASDLTGNDTTLLDPKLGPLQDNGGTTLTHALLAGSPAIDQGNNFGVLVDQRGQPRPMDDPAIANAVGGDGSDIGAFEAVPLYTLTVLTSGNGSVGKSPDQVSYPFGTVVTLTATPAAGWALSGWSGDASGSSTQLSVTMTNNKTITANFVWVGFTLSVTATGGAIVWVSPNQPLYASNTLVTLTAPEQQGWVFDHWSGDANGTNNPLSITMTNNMAITANFIPTYDLSITISGRGTVTFTPPPPPLADYMYVSNTLVSLQAIPNAGWQFVGWSGDLSGTNNPISFQITSNMDNVHATFTLIVVPTNSIWAQTFSGQWDAPAFWQDFVLPGPGQSTYVTNSGNKTVSIGGLTVTNSPGTMTVANLTVGSPGANTNTLWLNGAGTATPLEVTNGFSLLPGGAVALNNSALQINGSGVQIFDGVAVGTNGAVLSATNGIYPAAGAVIAIGNGSAGSLSLTNSSLAAYTLLVGSHAQGTFSMANSSGLVTRDMVIGDCAGGVSGTATLSGGALYVTNAAQTALVDVRNGTLTLCAGGSLVLDTLILTNVCGHFVNQGGTLTAGRILTIVPVLSISLSGTTVTVQWPNTPGWGLQQNSGLADANGWSSSGGVTTSNGTNYLNLISPAGTLFFRLKAQ
jgi:uncharacterized repeat protein (TIGR02543 family)